MKPANNANSPTAEVADSARFVEGRPDGGYRPALDGVRAVAVATVMVFHFRPSWLPAGFVGVDVFFVLSGYLITRLLIDELARSGRVRFAAFYARRARRLLPAAAVAIAGIGGLTVWLGNPLERAVVADDVWPATLAWSNWHFAARDADYFAPANDLDPFSHFWSLAVEEQFYLVWPALLAGCWWALCRLGLPVRRLVTAAATVASAVGLAWWWQAAGDAPIASYYATWFRAAQLGVGAALAGLGVRRLPARWGSPLALIGATGLAVVLAGFGTGDAYPGGWGPLVTVATGLLVAGLEADPISLTARSLSWRPAVYVGAVSYALYLWHVPVAEFLPRIGDRYDIWGLDRFATMCVASIGLAALSSVLVEKPIRFTPRLRGVRPLAVVGVALSLFVGSAAAVAAAVNRPADVEVVDVTASELEAAARDRPETYALGCHGGQEAPWTGGVCVRRAAAGQPVVAIVGDSHAGNWDAALMGAAQILDVEYRYATYSACPPVDVAWNEQSQAAGCRRFRDTVLPELATLGPGDVILVAFAWTSFVEDLAADPSVSPSDLTAAIETLRADLEVSGAKVVFMTPIPLLPRGGPQCLAEAAVADDCSHLIDGPSPEDQLAASVFGPETTLLDVADLVCPDQRCEAIRDGIVTYRDREHISQAYSASLATALAARLTLTPAE